MIYKQSFLHEELEGIKFHWYLNFMTFGCLIVLILFNLNCLVQTCSVQTFPLIILIYKKRSVFFNCLQYDTFFSSMTQNLLNQEGKIR